MKRILLAMALVAWVVTAVWGTVHAHPHSFLEARLAFVFDAEGLAGFKETWTMDEMTAFAVLDAIRENGDGVLDKDEVEKIKTVSMGSLKDYGYFNDVRIDGKYFTPKWVKDFSARMEGGKLIYEFFLPCHVKASERFKKVVLAVYDESFYVFVSYAVEGGESLDPTRDPMFANTQAGPSPEDYKRFSEAVGLTGYSGDVALSGPLDKFDIRARVEEMEEMAYFEGQILPEAFVLEFKARK